jgi:hypothetical protein
MSDVGVPFGLVPSDPDLRLRPTNAGDEPFTRHLFREVRGGQFVAAGLSGPILEQVVEQQFRSQAACYAAQYPDAISLVVTRNETAIGRLLLHCAGESWHVIALTLSVLATNAAARRFYLRQGFVEVGQAGASHIAMRKDLA